MDFVLEVKFKDGSNLVVKNDGLWFKFGKYTVYSDTFETPDTISKTILLLPKYNLLVDVDPNRVDMVYLTTMGRKTEVDPILAAMEGKLFFNINNLTYYVDNSFSSVSKSEDILIGNKLFVLSPDGWDTVFELDVFNPNCNDISFSLTEDGKIEGFKCDNAEYILTSDGGEFYLDGRLYLLGCKLLGPCAVHSTPARTFVFYNGLWREVERAVWKNGKLYFVESRYNVTVP